MRIWDIPAKKLCREHLLGEHRELHAIWNIIVLDKEGYKNHPETKRWVGKLPALRKRHEEEVSEMQRRGYKHNSPLGENNLSGSNTQDTFVNTKKEQIKILRDKKCNCLV